jgi:phosphonopyruvate decarboxylase
MIQPDHLFKIMAERGISFFAGVPDSLLKDFCAYVTDHVDDSDHVITANEGNAVALSAGHYLGTGRPGLVYLQNSGLGNTVNPLLSLNDPEVYGLPVLLMIGWRGEPNVKDEPQHIKQGRITPALLDAMEIPWQILESSSTDIAVIVDTAMKQMQDRSGPVALLVRKSTFAPYVLQKNAQSHYPLAREKAIQRVIEQLDHEDRVVATTGMPARELYELRIARGDGMGNDFLTVGSMGHAASIALGLARSQPARRVICLDGDGSVLMHMGSLAIVGQSQQENLIHVVLNNGAHDSVGGQPTCAFGVDLAGVARACGYREVLVAAEPQEIDQAFATLLENKGPSLLEIRISKGARADLGRPKSSPAENRDALMNQLGIERLWV